MANAPYKIINLGDVGWTDLNDAFKNNTTLESVTIGAGINQLTELINTFNGCSNLREMHVVDWDIGNIDSLQNFLKDTKLTTDSYSAMLIHFADNTTIQVGVVMHGGDAFYSVAGEVAKNTLVNVYQWDITDGGLTPIWVQIISTNSEGIIIDMLSNNSAPTFANTKCVKFHQLSDYVEIQNKLDDFMHNGIIDISFDLYRGSIISGQYLLDTGYCNNELGMSIYIVSNDITIYRKTSSATTTIKLSNCGITTGFYHIRIYSDSSGFTVETNGVPYTYSSQFTTTTDDASYNCRIGKPHPTFGATGTNDYIKLNNIVIEGICNVPMEEGYGGDCCDVFSIFDATLHTIGDDFSIMRSNFGSFNSKSYEWANGFNKIDEFTNAPSFSNPTVRKIKIPAHDTYVTVSTEIGGGYANPWLQADIMILDGQDYEETVVMGFGDLYSGLISNTTTGRCMVLLYNNLTNSLLVKIKSNKSASLVKKLSTTIETNKLYNIRMYYGASRWRLWINDIEVSSIYESAATIKYHDGTYIGMKPAGDGVTPDKSCKCICTNLLIKEIDSDTNYTTIYNMTDLKYGVSSTITDTSDTDVDGIITTENNISDCWASINDPTGVYVDCIENELIAYPPCKDGILHNGANVDFKNSITSITIESIILSDTTGGAIAGTYLYTGTYTDNKYWKHETEEAYIFHETSNYDWWVTGALGQLSNGMRHYSDSPYPPRTSWTLAPATTGSVGSLSYSHAIIGDDGYPTTLSYSDMLALTSADKVIIEKHINDHNVVVIDKMQIIE